IHFFSKYMPRDEIETELRRAPTRSPANSAISDELDRRSPTNSAILKECWREDELLSRYTDYFAKALLVSFPCVKMFNESPNLSTLIDVPLSHIPQFIYETTRNWMNLPPVEVLHFSVGMFLALAIILRCKPEPLTSVLPTLREDPKYQGHNKLPLYKPYKLFYKPYKLS
ncbi:hypothetical protein HID58_089471, partial [Brassica napus]